MNLSVEIYIRCCDEEKKTWCNPEDKVHKGIEKVSRISGNYLEENQEI